MKAGRWGDITHTHTHIRWKKKYWKSATKVATKDMHTHTHTGVKNKMSKVFTLSPSILPFRLHSLCRLSVAKKKMKKKN